MDPFICDAIAGNNEDLEMNFHKAITCWLAGLGMGFGISGTLIHPDFKLWMAGLVIGAIAIIMQLGDGK